MSSCYDAHILITSGAGFVSSHLVDALMVCGANIRVLDDLSNGSLENIKQWLNHPNFMFIYGDLLNPTDVVKAVSNCEIIYQ